MTLATAFFREYLGTRRLICLSTPVGNDGTIGTWTSQPISNTRPGFTITGLTPGTTYAFQVRALVDSTFSDWSDSLFRVCT